MFSTGAASAEVALRAVERYGWQQVTLLTADTRVEDDDNWRFAREVVDLLHPRSWEVVSDGRTPMQVGRDQRCVPNDRMAVCSRVLKRELLRTWIEENGNPDHTVVHLGYDWTEEHRLEKARPHWEPWTVAAPLCEPPFLTKARILDAWRERGIEPPRLYAQGFGHANCGGACVRGGQAAWELLLRVNRPRYLEWEAEEEQTRALLDKDVSILSDRRGGGKRRPLSLQVFRERLEATPGLFDADDWGACDCIGASV